MAFSFLIAIFALHLEIFAGIMTDFKWKSSTNDELPSDRQDVLISINGIYYAAVYDAPGKRFVLKYEIGVSFPVNSSVIYWKELTPP